MATELAGPSLEAYRALRKKLIDTTLRNRMINYRSPSARSAVGLEIRDELSSTIWTSLVTERKKLGFTGPPDPKGKEGELTLDLDLPPVVNDTADLLLFTPTPKSKRASRLVATARAAQEQLDERGVNTLFLALGMLEWKEPAETQTHRAPLVLVPVSLEPTSAGSYLLSYDESEISTNLSLIVKAKELGVSLPDISTDLDAFAPTDYYDQISKAIVNQDNWKVHANEIALSFFSFEKIALYIDLDAREWPEGKTPLHDTDVTAILGTGYEAGESTLTEETRIDDLRTASESREVFQADSSQLLVIMEACRGTSMVVEGPPGTGKSQTIANLVAELVSQGKKVLFVSEKMAALDVVYRRLEEAGLSEAALKLHGHKANRRSFYDAIKSTWFRQSRLNEATQQLQRLTTVRNQLNQYVKELHEPITPFGVSPRRLMTIASALPTQTPEDLESGYDPGPLRGMPWEDLSRLILDLRLLEDQVRQIGVPVDHPFWGSQLAFFGPDERQILERDLAHTQAELESLVLRCGELAHMIGIPVPSKMNQISVLHRSVELAVAAPPLDGIALKIGTWKTNESRIREVIQALRRYQEIRKSYDARVSPLAWDQDWIESSGAINRRSHSIIGRLTGEYRNATAKLKTFLITPSKVSPEEARELSNVLLEAQGLYKQIEDFHPTATTLFGVQWEGSSSNPAQLAGLLDWVLMVEGDVSSGELPDSLLKFFTGNMDSVELSRRSRQLSELEARVRNGFGQLEHHLRIDVISKHEELISDIQLRLETWRSGLSRIGEIVGWNQIVRELEGRNLASVISLASQWTLASTRLSNHVIRHWAHDGIRTALESRPSLQRFERIRHEDMIAEFGRLDDLALQHNRSRVAHAHLTNLPVAGAVGLTAELFRQLELKRGHKPIRWAFERFGDLILQIKPICMMSPLSVATFLPRQLELFDAVIFDEASQVKPEDALSAISRAKQTVVVGDSKQMPPTSFFDSLAKDEQDDGEEYDEAIGMMESILALTSAAVQNSHRRRDLKWHYRSLHHALIQPSNRLFYEDKLVVFPSPVYATNEAASELGLRFRYDPNAVYDRGAAKKVNLIQAEQIALAAIDNIKSFPQESLMIVAFSKDQQDAITDAFERLSAASPGMLSEYAAKNPHERFAVKNLETVQGDERDVVLISIGYGRDIKGALSMNFGPLNKESGGRRLNVLMSRAKKRVEVFTSIRAGDIVVDDQKENGVRALKVFLDFAETGFMEDRTPIGKEEDSEFEIQVRNAIESHGYRVDTQVGTAGFRIDLAVRNPKKPGLYVIGIECDGASYHSAKSARDRDKLRQLVLESRGWTIHRVWSTDWWMDRESTTKRILSAIEHAIAVSDEEIELAKVEELPVDAEPKAGSLEVWEAPATLQIASGVPYKVWDRPFDLNGLELHELSPELMGRCVHVITAFEGPIHVDLVTKRIRDSAGKGRAGSRIQVAISEGIDSAIRLGNISKSGDFLYPLPAQPILARSRASVGTTEKKIEWVADEELDDAILTTLRDCRSATPLEVADSVRKILGFQRTPEALVQRVQDRMNLLDSRGNLFFAGNTASLSNS